MTHPLNLGGMPTDPQAVALGGPAHGFVLAARYGIVVVPVSLPTRPDTGGPIPMTEVHYERREVGGVFPVRALGPQLGAIDRAVRVRWFVLVASGDEGEEAATAYLWWLQFLYAVTGLLAPGSPDVRVHDHDDPWTFPALPMQVHTR